MVAVNRDAFADKFNNLFAKMAKKNDQLSGMIDKNHINLYCQNGNSDNLGQYLVINASGLR